MLSIQQRPILHPPSKVKDKEKTREVSLMSLPALQVLMYSTSGFHPHLHGTLETRKERIRTDSLMAPFYAIFSGICTCHKLSGKLNLQTKYMLHLQS